VGAENPRNPVESDRALVRLHRNNCLVICVPEGRERHAVDRQLLGRQIDLDRNRRLLSDRIHLLAAREECDLSIARERPKICGGIGHKADDGRCENGGGKNAREPEIIFRLVGSIPAIQCAACRRTCSTLRLVSCRI
jgi:hypothetical protein